jgi:hypothetical protein
MVPLATCVRTAGLLQGETGPEGQGVVCMLCYAMLCYAMLCYAMLCYAMLCYAMLCYWTWHGFGTGPGFWRRARRFVMSPFTEGEITPFAVTRCEGVGHVAL